MTHTVYTYLDRDGTPLYVGCTVRFPQREAALKSSAAWFSQVASTTTETFAHRADALKREAELLVSLDPPFNRKPTRAFSRHAERRTKTVGFRLSVEADELLSGIATSRGISRTAALETLIREAAHEAGTRPEQSDA